MAMPFIHAIALGAMAVGLYVFAIKWVNGAFARSILLGAILGVGGVLSMLSPLSPTPGIMIDGRGTFVGIAALFGGLPAGVVSGIAVMAMRFDIGGAGVWPALLTVVIIVLSGALIRAVTSRHGQDIGAASLFGLIGATALANLAGLVNIPSAVDPWELSDRLLAPLTLANAVGILFCGGLLIEARRRENESRKLAILANRLDTLTRTDELTGLYNRRHLEEAFRTEWARAARRNEALSLIMLDVDRFKQFNDRYGHPAGDRCLTLVGHAIGRSVRRAEDVAVRYGGEEFAILLPATDAEGAAGIAAALLQSIRDAGIPHEKGILPIVTASIGVATIYPSAGIATDRLLDDADRALYQAKQTGRNRVVTTPPVGLGVHGFAVPQRSDRIATRSVANRQADAPVFFVA